MGLVPFTQLVKVRGGNLVLALPSIHPLQPKMLFLPQIDKVGFGGGASEQKINFCLKWSKRVQMGPKGSQMIKKT